MATEALTKLSIENAVPEAQRAKNNIAQARANLNAGGQRQGATIVAPSTPIVTPAISPSDLTPTPVIDVPTPATPTQTTSMMAEFETGTDEFTKQQEQARKEAESTKGNALDDYLKSLQSAQGLTGLTAQEYAKEGGVDSISPELNEINDKIRREQLALRRAKEAIEAKGGGLKAGAASEIANLERESFAKQADLSIIQMAVQGRYDSAKEIADRAVSAKLEQQNIYNEALKFAYTEAKDLFTTAEQREFETLLGNRERAIKSEEDRLKQINDFALSALQAGAPTSLVEKAMKSKTMEEAIGLVGNFLRPQPTGTGKRDTAFDKDGNLVDMQTGEVIRQSGGGAAEAGQQEQIQETLSLARELLSDTAVGKGSAIGASFAKFVPFGQSLGLQGDRSAFENKVNTLKANLTLPNLALLKGPMSDKDIAFLQAIGSSITTNMSEAEFDNQVKNVIKKFEQKLGTPTASGSMIVVAPDGTEVEITD